MSKHFPDMISFWIVSTSRIWIVWHFGADLWNPNTGGAKLWCSWFCGCCASRYVYIGHIASCSNSNYPRVDQTIAVLPVVWWSVCRTDQSGTEFEIVSRKRPYADYRVFVKIVSTFSWKFPFILLFFAFGSFFYETFNLVIFDSFFKNSEIFRFSILDENFYFWPKFLFLTKKLIFDKNFNFWQ